MTTINRITLGQCLRTAATVPSLRAKVTTEASQKSRRDVIWMPLHLGGITQRQIFRHLPPDDRETKRYARHSGGRAAAEPSGNRYFILNCQPDTRQNEAFAFGSMAHGSKNQVFIGVAGKV